MLWSDADDTSRDEALGLRPELAAEVRRLHEAIWAGPVSPVTLELCRLRMATLLRSPAALAERTEAARDAGCDEARIAALPSWPTNPAFSPEERACLAFAEAWVIDPHSITDDDAAAVTAALGADGMVTFTTALGVWDGQHRFDNALGISRAGRG